MDSIYLETALKHHAALVSLDEDDFLLRIKGRARIEIYHPKDFPQALKPPCEKHK